MLKNQKYQTKIKCSSFIAQLQVARRCARRLARVCLHVPMETKENAVYLHGLFHWVKKNKIPECAPLRTLCGSHWGRRQSGRPASRKGLRALAVRSWDGRANATESRRPARRKTCRPRQRNCRVALDLARTSGSASSRCDECGCEYCFVIII